VKPGEPSVTFDAERPAAPDLHAYMHRVRALQSRAVQKNSFLPTIESTDPALSKALLVLAMHETAEQHVAVAVAYRNDGVLDYAFRHFQRATVLEPCDAAAYDGMARIWRDWGMPDIALSDAYRAVHCDGRSAAAHNTLGTIFEILGQPSAAASAYQRAVTIDPGAAFALNNLCHLDIAAGNVNGAKTLCERALTEEPGLWVARNNLALVEARLGNLAAAEQRLRTGPQDGTAFYNAGVLKLSQQRFAEAAVLFDKAAATEPALTIARLRLVQARKAARAAEQTP
jgi:Flp pilus assembly protein TadD